MKKSSRGFSLIEIMMSTVIFSVIGVAVFSIYQVVFKSSINIEKGNNAKDGIHRIFSSLSKKLFNVALIQPEEGMFSPADGLYRGVFGLTSAPNCKRVVDQQGKETYSILRFSTMLNQKNPELLLRAWNENTLSTKNVRVSYHDGHEYPFQKNQLADIKEILMIDIDGLLRKRFEVKNATHIGPTNKDPYDDKVDPKKKFEWTELSLALPKIWAGTSQSPISQWYITNSIVYPIETQYLCVDNNSSLVLRNELKGTQEVLFDSQIEDLKITRFEVTYFASKDGQRLSRDDFYPFPETVEKLRKCINTINIRISLTSNFGLQKEKNYEFNRMIILNSLNLHRPKLCQN